MRLLLVEDDAMVGSAMEQALVATKHCVDWFKSAEDAEQARRHTEYDLVILDLGLPKADGVELLKRWRRQGLHMPVLIVTARDAPPDRVDGLNSGADDYLVKPFDLHEFIARVHALLRRSQGRGTPEIVIGTLMLDPQSHVVKLDEQPVSLSAREFAVLHTLMASPGHPISKADLEGRIYRWDEEIDSNTVEVHIHSLRRKLGHNWIRNMRGIGYFVPAQVE